MNAPNAEPRGQFTLADGRVGEPYRIGSIELDGAMGDRLVELGLTHAAPVEILRRAPFGGPFQLRVRDFVLTLRTEHVASIWVTARYATS